MLSTIGFVSVMLIVFTVGFAVGRKPREPIKINLKFEEFAVEDLELYRNIFKSVADCIDDALVDLDDEEDGEATEEEKSDSVEVVPPEGSETVEESEE